MIQTVMTDWQYKESHWSWAAAVSCNGFKKESKEASLFN